MPPISRTDPLSLRIHRFVGGSFYRVLYGFVVAVFLLLAFVESPSSLSKNSGFIAALVRFSFNLNFMDMISRHMILFTIIYSRYFMLAETFLLPDFTVDGGKRYELPFGVTHSIEFVCILLFTADFIARCRISDK